MIASIVIYSCTKADKKNSYTKSNEKNLFFTTDSIPPMSIEDLFALDTVDINKVTIEYYIDEVLTMTPITNFENNYPIFSAIKDVDDSSARIIINTFSSEGAFLSYGDNNGYRLSEAKNFIETVQHEADIENYLDLDELEYEGDIVPNTFRENVVNYNYETMALGGIFAGSFQVWDDIVPSGSTSILPLTTDPWLISWDNKIGCVMGYSSISLFVFFDRTFYRNFLGVVGNWGFTHISFSSYFGLSHFNNRVTSYVHIAI